jgi:fucose permease
VREDVLDYGMQEELEDATRPVNGETSKIYYFGVALLCIIMFVYVGVENGVGFFLNGFMYSTMDSEKGYLALSLFWFSMIPARILCGIFAKYREALLCLASIGATAFLLVLSMVKSENVTFLVVFILGFFCGAVYPNVLTYAADFAGGRTATVIAAITVATGVGGTLVSGVFGFLENMLGYSASFVVLMAFMAIDIVISIWVVKIGRRVVQ